MPEQEYRPHRHGPVVMLDQQQAKTVLALVRRTIGVDVSDNITDVPNGFDLATVADAVATLEATANGEDLRPLVVEYLSRLAPALVVAGIDTGDKPVSAQIEQLRSGASELLDRLGSPLSTWTRRMFVIRDGVMLDMPGWLPLEVLDALARIGKATGIEVATAPALACGVEWLAARDDSHKVIAEEMAKLLSVLDPDFDGTVTATAVEVAAQRVGHQTRPCTMTRPTPNPFADTVPASVAADTTKRPPGWHRVCSYANPVYAVIRLSEVLGATISSGELDVMALGEETKYSGGASIIRTAEGWELWSDGGGDRG